MKKSMYLIPLMVFIATSCIKNVQDEREMQKDLLLSEITEVVNTNLESINSIDLVLQNENNPFEYAGTFTGKTMYNLLTNVAIKKSDPDSLKINFLNAINQNLPESVLHPDTTDFDQVERTIENYLMDIFAKEGFEKFVVKSKQMEDIVINSAYFSQVQKNRVLIFSTLIRHNVGAIKTVLSEHKSEDFGNWATCFHQKFVDLQNCQTCYIEKALLLFEWPKVFATWALDCIIYIMLDMLA